MSTSLCLCCFQTFFLNNLNISQCSPQLFLPGDSPELKETTQPFAHACAHIQFMLMLYGPSCILSYILCHTWGIAFVQQHQQLFFCQDSPFHCGAKLKPVLREQGLDSVRSCCLMCHSWPQAMKWRGSYAQPWPESAPFHNSTVRASHLCLSFLLRNRKESEISHFFYIFLYIF